jgi:rubrerythrin
MPYKKGSRTMPPVKTPQLLQRCVAGVSDRFAAEHGGEPTREDVSRAFAICTAQGQRYGKYEPGTRTLTPRGKGLTTAVRRDKRKDLERYETVLQEARDDIRAPSGAMSRMSDASWWCPACRVRAGMSPVDLRRGPSGSISRMSNTSWWCPACQTKQIARPMAPVYGASGAISGPRVAAIAIGSAVIGAAATYWWKKQGG